MKKTFLIFACVVAGAGVFALGWFCSAGYSKRTNLQSQSSDSLTGNLNHSHLVSMVPIQTQQAPIISPADSQHLFEVRQAAMRNNPDLVAEYKQLLSDLQAEEAKVDAAMVKVDPKVAPIFAKLTVLRQRFKPLPPPSASGSNSK